MHGWSGGWPTGDSGATKIRRRDTLPDGLRSGIEQLSGVSMDHVRVHYGSDRPAQLQAHAYAKGSDIHVGPGQERHLAHEAWHVVQQAQGRVRPTTRLGGNVPANEDGTLEREAEEMGERAVRAGERGGDGAQHGALAPTATAGPAQLVREDEFRAAPQTFLQGNVLSLTMLQGLHLRSNDKKLTDHYDAFLRAMGHLPRHWFKLVVDTARDKPAQHAYILTPALEKYVAAYPEDEAFAGLADTVTPLLPTEADDAYISSAYVDYKNIGADADDEDTIGHTEVIRSADDDSGEFNPDLVFTAAMNGCAFAVTPSADDRKFVAWHFQSTTANREAAASFRNQKGPTDWFGEDEYDDRQHEGLFEVTNMLHRGADGGWNVISQQNETSAKNQNDITIKDVTSRPLQLDVPARAAIIKRIYTSLQTAKNREMRDSVTNAMKYEKYADDAEKGALMRLKISMLTMLDAEEAAIAGANTLAELTQQATAVRTMRTQNTDVIDVATEALAVHFDAKLAAEESRWSIMQDKTALVRLPLASSNLRLLAKFYGQFVWLTSMITELTQPQPEEH